MRVFVAIDLTEEIRKKAVELINQLKGLDIDAKFTAPENLHITMKFLGEADEQSVKDIEAAISDTLKDFHPFNVSIQGIGYFGNPKHIKTLWIDTGGEGREELVKMAKALNASLDHIRHEDRDPKPHITLGRVKSGRHRDELLKKLEAMNHVKLGKMDMKLVTLKKSELSKEGPHYTDLNAFELA
jgi:2'-5' RNA ligase